MVAIQTKVHVEVEVEEAQIIITSSLATVEQLVTSIRGGSSRCSRKGDGNNSSSSTNRCRRSGSNRNRHAMVIARIVF